MSSPPDLAARSRRYRVIKLGFARKWSAFCSTTSCPSYLTLWDPGRPSPASFSVGAGATIPRLASKVVPSDEHILWKWKFMKHQHHPFSEENRHPTAPCMIHAIHFDAGSECSRWTTDDAARPGCGVGVLLHELERYPRLGYPCSNMFGCFWDTHPWLR